MTQVRVKLNSKIVAKRGGFVDPENGVTISVRRYDAQGSQVVERTQFIATRINSGELIEVSLAGKDHDAEKIEVRFLTDVKVGRVQYRVGETAKVSAEAAEKLKEAGKVE